MRTCASTVINFVLPLYGTIELHVSILLPGKLSMQTRNRTFIFKSCNSYWLSFQELYTHSRELKYNWFSLIYSSGITHIHHKSCVGSNSLIQSCSYFPQKITKLFKVSIVILLVLLRNLRFLNIRSSPFWVFCIYKNQKSSKSSGQEVTNDKFKNGSAGRL